jgi:cytochrome c oxidase subunit 1
MTENYHVQFFERKLNRKGQFSLLLGKITSFKYLETLGQIHFWITFFGVNLTFIPMHVLGLVGMPHCIPNYPNAYAGWNAFSSFDSYVSIKGFLCFIVVVFLTSTNENKCAPSPWAVEQNSTTLEWMVKSSPTFHTFKKLPAIK